MSIYLVTGLAVLIGSEAVLYFGQHGTNIVANDMCRYFFGEEALTAGTSPVPTKSCQKAANTTRLISAHASRSPISTSMPATLRTR